MFNGYVALVTGSESGIGLGIATEFIEQGATVVGVSKTDRGAAGKLGDRYVFRQCDVTDLEQVEAVCRFVAERFSQLDILVNCAGFSIHVSLEDMTTEQWEHQFRLLVRGPMWFAKHCAPLLRKSKNASIVNVGSCSSERVGPSRILYDVPKAALKWFTDSCVAELPGIRSNLVQPGFVETPIFDRVGYTPEYKKMLFEYSMANTIPMGRLGEPKDVAKAVAFICSEDATFINGAYLRIDGGWTVCAHLQVKTRYDGQPYVSPEEKKQKGV